MINWLNFARELHALAQTGLYYTQDIYDRERYERIKEMSDEMMAVLMSTTPEAISVLRSEDSGYQTPKVDTRGAVWNNENKILLVQENDGFWSLPGGWMDVTETVSSNVLKEIKEEAGCNAKIIELVAIQDRNTHNPGNNPYTIIKIFVNCIFESLNFEKNSETIDAQFFDINDLPPLYEAKTTKEQILLCARAYQSKNKWQVTFD